MKFNIDITKQESQYLTKLLDEQIFQLKGMKQIQNNNNNVLEALNLAENLMNKFDNGMSRLRA